MLSKDGNYYINLTSYETDIKNKNVKKSIRHLIREIGYKRIKNLSVSNGKETIYVIFIRGGNNNDEFGLIYTNNKLNKYGLVMDSIGDNWYYHWMGYDIVK